MSSRKCWYSGKKRSTTSRGSLPRAAGWFFAILREEGNREGEVERLVKVGATRYPWRYKLSDDFVVLEDPHGNLFCVVEVAETQVTRGAEEWPEQCRSQREKL